MPAIILQRARIRAGSRRNAFWLLLLSLLCVGVSRGESKESNQGEGCLQAAKKELGPAAVVLKSGHLTGTSALECVAAVPLKHFRNTADGTPVSSFVIL